MINKLNSKTKQKNQDGRKAKKSILQKTYKRRVSCMCVCVYGVQMNTPQSQVAFT